MPRRSRSRSGAARSRLAGGALGLLGLLPGLLCCAPEPLPPPTPLPGFETPFYFGGFTVPADNPLTVEGVALGRMLFYEERLSADDTISCATCHQPARAFTDGRTLARGIHGARTPRNTMSLANLLWGPQRFFWDGRAVDLEQQAGQPIVNPDEMGSTWDEVIAKLERAPAYPASFEAAFGTREITPERVTKALASFERTMVSTGSRYDRYLRGELRLDPREQRGRELFMTHPDAKAGIRGANCIDCHSQFLTSGFAPEFDGFQNNGLDDDDQLEAGLMAVTGRSRDRGRFKAPTLRNIELTAPYMHDGRFATLEEVIDHYSDHVVSSSTLDPLIREAANTPGAPLGVTLTHDEKAALLAFLRTLTDHEFVHDPSLSDPGA